MSTPAIRLPTPRNGPAPSTRDTGMKGEAAAIDWFTAKFGGTLIGRNLRDYRGEIDLVFALGDGVVFVEVRTAHPRSPWRPEQTFTYRKKKALAWMIQKYIQDENLSAAWMRVDLLVWQGEWRHFPGIELG